MEFMEKFQIGSGLQISYPYTIVTDSLTFTVLFITTIFFGPWSALKILSLS